MAEQPSPARSALLPAMREDSLGERLRGFLSHFDHAEIWCPSLENGHLFCLPPLCNSESEFVVMSAAFRFPFGRGTPGRVWKEQRAESIQDIAEVDESFYLRRATACRAGYRKLVGVPVHSPDLPGGFPACVFVGYAKKPRVLPAVKDVQRCAQEIFAELPRVKHNISVALHELHLGQSNDLLRALLTAARRGCTPAIYHASIQRFQRGQA